MTVAFRGRLGFCSNFYSCTVVVGGIEYLSAEHAFVAAKTTDEFEKRQIARIPTAGAVKRYGRQITLRPDWGQVKVDEMRAVLMAKFMQNRDLGAALLATGAEYLVELNEWHDNEWGRCTCKTCESKTGKNKLGLVLMEVRAALSQDREEARRL